MSYERHTPRPGGKKELPQVSTVCAVEVVPVEALMPHGKESSMRQFKYRLTKMGDSVLVEVAGLYRVGSGSQASDCALWEDSDNGGFTVSYPAGSGFQDRQDAIADELSARGIRVGVPV